MCSGLLSGWKRPHVPAPLSFNCEARHEILAGAVTSSGAQECRRDVEMAKGMDGARREGGVGLLRGLGKL